MTTENHFIIAVLFALAAAAMTISAAMWYAFVRATPQHVATGMITGKTFQPARTVMRYQGGARRELWTEDRITIPESYVFDIRVGGFSAPMRFSVAAPVAKRYEIGQNARVCYIEHSIPFLWRRFYVTEMDQLALSKQ